MIDIKSICLRKTIVPTMLSIFGGFIFAEDAVNETPLPKEDTLTHEQMMEKVSEELRLSRGGVDAAASYHCDKRIN